MHLTPLSPLKGWDEVLTDDVAPERLAGRALSARIWGDQASGSPAPGQPLDINETLTISICAW